MPKCRLRRDLRRGPPWSETGERIKAAAAVRILAVHPENPLIHTINQTLFAAPCATSRAASGRGTPWWSRPAASTARLRHGHELQTRGDACLGQIAVGETFTHDR
ncbi:MAG: hypothetical protein R3D25_21315 [Geminicoccaceae bacterium]